MKIIKNEIVYGSEKRAMLTDIFFNEGKRKQPVIVYVHGFNGFKDWGNFDLIAKEFTTHGYAFVKMNLSHNGTTTQKPEEFDNLEAYSRNNYTKELYDVECILDWVIEPQNPYSSFFDTDKIILLGHSRGGGISILKASEDARVKALITWASVAQCKTPWVNWSQEKMQKWKEEKIAYIENKRTMQMLPLHYQLVEDYINNSSRLDIETAIKKLNIPTQICHGLNDEAVPFFEFQKFKLWKPDADFYTLESNHTFGRVHPNTTNEISADCRKVIAANISFLTGAMQ